MRLETVCEKHERPLVLQVGSGGRYQGGTCPCCREALRSVLDGELWCWRCERYW